MKFQVFHLPYRYEKAETLHRNIRLELPLSDDAPEKTASTKTFFNDVKNGYYDIYISSVVLREIGAAPEPKRKLLYETIDQYDPEILRDSHEVNELADIYISVGILHEKHILDVFHLAAATAGNMDLLISWNMRHIVKRKTQVLVNQANRLNGYGVLEIVSPQEMIDDENSK